MLDLSSTVLQSGCGKGLDVEASRNMTSLSAAPGQTSTGPEALRRLAAFSHASAQASHTSFGIFIAWSRTLGRATTTSVPRPACRVLSFLQILYAGGASLQDVQGPRD